MVRRLLFQSCYSWGPKPLPSGLTLSSARLDLSMKSRLLSWALLACIATGALVLSGCSTIRSRIDANRAAFDQLPPQEQALVSQGKIQGRYVAGSGLHRLGPASGKGRRHGARDADRNLGLYPLTAAYGPYGYGGGLAMATAAGAMRACSDFTGAMAASASTALLSIRIGIRIITPFRRSVSYPVKTVSFQRGRVVAFQYLSPSAY